MHIVLSGTVRWLALAGAGFGLVPAGAQMYSETDKKTFIYLFPQGWDMKNNEVPVGSLYIGPSGFPSGLTIPNIVSTHLQIRSDNGQYGVPERTSSIYRLNWRDNSGTLGNWGGQYHLYCDASMQCIVSPRAGKPNLSIFRLGDNQYLSSTTPRAILKMEYLGAGTTPPPGALPANDYYFKLPGWNMNTNLYEPNSRGIGLSGMSTGNIAMVSATIQSDPVNGSIQVNNFERRGNTLLGMKRGGWVDVVATTSTTSNAILYLYGTKRGFSDPSGDFRASMFNGPEYTSTSASRGWLKVTYAGTSPVSQPFIIKSKMVKLGGWPIYNRATQAEQGELPLTLSDFGVSPNRIVHAEALTVSDPVPGTNPETFYLTDLRRANYAHTSQGHIDAGYYTIDGASDKIRLWASGFASDNTYYSNFHERSDVNRGWFQMDYLVGDCSAGGSGYSLKAIGLSAKVAGCGGSGNLVLFGSGARILNSADEFSYEYKAVENASTRNLIARLVSKSPASDFTNPALVRTGIMIRAGLNTGDKFAAIVINSSGGCVFRYRDGANTVDVPYTGTTVTSPWIRLTRTNSTSFNAFYSTSSTMPTNWGTPFATSQISSFPIANYNNGIVATNAGEKKLNRAEYASLSGF